MNCMLSDATFVRNMCTVTKIYVGDLADILTSVPDIPIVQVLDHVSSTTSTLSNITNPNPLDMLVSYI